MSLTVISSSTALVPASMALGMTTTVLALRAEQKRTEEVVREALAKTQETCLALTAEIATLKAEIVVLKERAKATESLHLAALKAKDVHNQSLQSQVKTLQAHMKELEKERAVEKAKKASAILAITKLAHTTPRGGRFSLEFIAYYTLFRRDCFKILEDFFQIPLKDLI